MAEKTFKVRLINKHDIEANWLKAVNFVPKQAEIIVYDVDENHNYERFKIGDGETLVSELPFQNFPLTKDPNMQLVTDADGTARWEERTHWVETTTTTFVDNAALVIEDGQAFDPSASYLELHEEKAYNIIWNGVTYRCIAQRISLGEDSTVALGNVSIFFEDGSVSSTDEPFAILILPPESQNALGGITWGAYVLDGATEVAISIQGENETVHPIDAKYFGNLRGQKKITIRLTLDDETSQFVSDTPFNDVWDIDCSELQNVLHVVSEDGTVEYSVVSVTKREGQHSTFKESKEIYFQVRPLDEIYTNFTPEYRFHWSRYVTEDASGETRGRDQDNIILVDGAHEGLLTNNGNGSYFFNSYSEVRHELGLTDDNILAITAPQLEEHNTSETAHDDIRQMLVAITSDEIAEICGSTIYSSEEVLL